VCILPGSHNKVVRIDSEGRIEAIWTSLAGETTRSLAEHTVLAGSMPPGGLSAEPDADWFERGAALGRKGLLHAAFSVRAAQVLAGASPEQCAALLVGAVVGADVQEMIRSRLFSGDVAVLVGGSDPLRRLYAQEASRFLQRVQAATEDASVHASLKGAAQIALMARNQTNAR
jgi:2-dehydro-3-deoxygalactonokinase